MEQDAKTLCQKLVQIRVSCALRSPITYFSDSYLSSACWSFPFCHPSLFPIRHYRITLFTSHWSPKLVGIFWYPSGSKHAVATCLLYCRWCLHVPALYITTTKFQFAIMAPFTRFKYKSSPDLPIHWQIPTAEPENSCPTCHGMIYTNLAHGGSNSMPEMPEFWKVPPVEPGRPLSYLAATLWRFLCIISTFRPDLKEHWVSKQDPQGWEMQKDRMVSRLSNTNTTVRPLFTHLPYILIVIHSCRPV